MPNDPVQTILNAIGGPPATAVADEGSDDTPLGKILSAIGKKSNPTGPPIVPFTLQSAPFGPPSERAAGLDQAFPTEIPPQVDTTKIARDPFTNRFLQPFTPELAREEAAAEDAAKEATVRAGQRGKFPAMSPKMEAANEASNAAVMSGSSKLPLPAFTEPGPTNPYPLGLRLSNVGELSALTNEYLNRPDIPKTTTQAFFASAPEATVKSLNDMFLSPMGLTASVLGLTETVALARAGQFGTDAAKLAQDYEAMRAAGATGAELTGVENKMRQSILSAAKAQRAATLARKAGTGAAAGFGLQGAGGVEKGIEEKNPAEILGGVGQMVIGGAGAVGAVRGGGIEAGVKAETAKRVSEAVKGSEVTAKRTQQVTPQSQQPPSPAQLPPTTTPSETVGAGEATTPERPETLQAQTDALAKGTNKVVYFPRGTKNIPAPPEGMVATTVWMNKPGAGTYYHTPDITPQQIKKAVAKGTYGELLGHEQTKEEATAPGTTPAVVVARGADGNEAKASVVDSSRPELVQKQAETLAQQFPQAQISVEPPEQVAAGRQTPTAPENLQPNASGESEASLEAINRQRSEKAAGTQRIRIDTRSGNETPLIGPEAVDAKAGPYDRIVQRKADGSETVLDEGPKAKATPVKAQGPTQPAREEQAPGVYDLGEIGPVGEAEQPKPVDVLAQKVSSIEKRQAAGEKIPLAEIHELHALMNQIEASHAEPERKPATGQPSAAAGEKHPAQAAKAPTNEPAKTEEAALAKEQLQKQPAEVPEGAERPEGAANTEGAAGAGPVNAPEGAAGAKPVVPPASKATQARNELVRQRDTANLAPLERRRVDAAIQELDKRIAQENAEEREKAQPAVDRILEAIKARPESVKVNIGGKMEKPEEVHETGTPGLYATKYEGKWALTHGPTGKRVPVGAVESAEDAIEAAKKLKDVTDWTSDFKNLKKWESAALGDKVTKALEKSASMRAAEESLEKEKPESKIEPEKESGNEEPQPVGQAGGGALAEVPAENVRPTVRERGAVRQGAEGGGANAAGVSGRNNEGAPATRELGGGEAESHVPAGRGRRPASRREPGQLTGSNQPGNDYRITPEDHIGEGGPRQKYAYNVEAIRILKDLESTGRAATPDEQSKLVKYSGWGWTGNALFNEWSASGREWNKEREELKKLLTDDEFRAASASTTNAHYTSPEVITAMWDAVHRLGFDGGRILEPSAGVGHFLGLMPSDLSVNSRKTAIELDPISGRILKQLYQNADVRIQGFQDLKGLNNFYDLAISNVPFGDYKVHDPAYNKLKLSIHNYFITKMLDKVRPGGIVAAITSSHTMDAYESQIRKNFADRGDFLGAIRLPNTAFQKNAGTEVTTDMLFFRKRGPDEKPAGEDFLKTKPMNLEDKYGYRGNAEVNEYYHKFPMMALGEHSRKGTMYAGEAYALVPKSGQDTGELLKAAINQLPEGAMRAQAVPESVAPDATYESIPNYGETKLEGLMVKDGKVYRRTVDGMKPEDYPQKSIYPLKKMLELRDTLRDLFQMEARGEAPAALSKQRGLLNRLYDAFTEKYGKLHEFSNRRAMEYDPDQPLLLSLEKYNPKTKEATKSDVFTKQTVGSRKPVEHVDNAKEALQVSLAERGRLDFDHMAKLTGMNPEELQSDLRAQGLVFHSPEGHWETTDAYLSGNVRKKLREAQDAAAADPEFKSNVEALEKIQPEWKEAGRIKVNIGSTWIPASDMADFVNDRVLEGMGGYRSKAKVTHVESEAIWKVKAPDASGSVAKWGVTDKNGTVRYTGIDLIQDALNMKQPTIWDPIPGSDPPKRELNQDLTMAAREKLEKMQKEFADWVFQNPERADRLVKEFNERYNNSVPRKYDGSHLTLPGMSTGIVLRGAQKNMIWRAIAGNNESAYHQVGLGKTFEAIAIAMEKRRLGLAKKPLITVPNHMVEQWSNDWRKLYPNANILAITKEDFGGEKRKEFISRIATGDWDGVILAHSSFGKIPVTVETEQRYLQEQLDQLEEHIRDMREEEGKKGPTVKELEKAKRRVEAKLQEAMDRETKDNTIHWEHLGVDSLIVDEAHEFKNLMLITKMGRVAGVPTTDAKRAYDMYIKVRHISDLNNGKNVHFLTGTPISNTMAEIYNMMRYLDPKKLAELGVSHFDSWAATFGQVQQNWEVSPNDVTRFRVASRFSKFMNLNELLSSFHNTGDVKFTSEVEGLTLPNAKRTTHVSKPSTVQKAYVKSLGDRADALKGYREQLNPETGKMERIGVKKPEPEEDNALKITGDGRKAALDFRMIDPTSTDEPSSKINEAVKNIAEIYHRTTATKRTQVVFLDMGIPGSETFDAYKDMKNKLVARGVPADEIAFIHSAKKDEAKQALFDKVNAGTVRILFGSTQKMGVGTNVQERLIALHHMDAPWRPSDIEQREGRIVRQGNSNPDVELHTYITEETFDAYSWQTIERKAGFIGQAMRNETGADEAEDVDGRALTAAEIKALATGNPDVMEKMKVDTEVAKLQRLAAQHESEQVNNRLRLAKLPEEISGQESRISAYEADKKTVDENPTQGDKFTALLGKTTYTDRAEAGTAINSEYAKARASEKASDFRVIGKFAGMNIEMSGVGNAYLHGEQWHQFSVNLGNPAGTIQSMEATARGLGTSIGNMKDYLGKLKGQQKQREAQAGQQFDRAAELTKLLEKQKALEKKLEVNKSDMSAARADQNAEYTQDGKIVKPSDKTQEEIDKMTRDIASGNVAGMNLPVHLIAKYLSLVIQKGVEAYKARKAAKAGKPTAAAQPAGGVPFTPPGAPERAGNIRLDKLNAPEDVINEIKRTAKDNEEFIDQRRGVQHFADTQKAAEEMLNEGLFTEKDLERMKKGTALNAEELLAARRMLIASAKEVREAAKVVQDNPSPEAVLKFQQLLQRHAGIQRAVSGAVAEAGRALSQQRIIARAMASKDRSMHENVISALGGQKLSEEAAKRLAQIDPKDYVALNNFIREHKNWDNEDWILAYWRANVLSSPRTYIRKGLGDVTLAATEGISRGIAGAIDPILAALAKRPREYFVKEAAVLPAAYIAALPEAARKFAYVMAHGFEPPDETLSLEPAMRYELRGGLKNPLNWAPRALKATTLMAQHLAFEGELRAQAVKQAFKEGKRGKEATARAAELVQHPTPGMIDTANKQAQLQTFTEAPDRVMRIITQIRNLNYATKFLIPFVQVPYNVAKTAVRYTPFNAAFNPKKLNPKDKESARMYASMIAGSLFMGAMAYLWMKDELTGAAPKGSAQRDAFYRAGKQPFSVKLGNHWVSYLPWGHFGLLASGVTGAAERAKEGGKKGVGFLTSMVSQLGAAMGQALLEESFLRGIKSVLDAGTDPKKADQLASNIAGGFVPMESALRTLNDALDPTIRDPKGMFERIQAGLPIASKEIRAKLDALGRPLQKEGSRGFKALFPGGITKAAPQTDMDAELTRLEDLGLRNIGFVGKSMTIDSYKIPLDQDERDQYQKLRGNYLQAYLKNLFGSEEYKNMTDEDRIDAAQQAIRDAEADAREAMADGLIKQRLERAHNEVPFEPPRSSVAPI